MLSDRRQRVLGALIEEYVAYALPVGSRTLIERYPLGVSSATVRNELSHLEEEGYVVQPHTSAGRVPTDAGYRAFVDDLMAHDLVKTDQEYASRVEQLLHSSIELDQLFERVSLELARFTDCLSVVLAPTFLNFNIKQVSLVSLAEHVFLCIVVTSDGQVFNRHVETALDANASDLAVVQTYLNNMLAEKSLSELEDGLLEGFVSSLHDPLLSLVVSEIVACLREGVSSKPHRLGMSGLLAKPEFTQTKAILPVIQMLEDDAVLLEIVGNSVRAPESSAPLVRIGSENGTEALSGVSVVANKFGEGDSAGVIAVIGPTRMNYSRVIAAVSAARDILNDV